MEGILRWLLKSC